MALSSSTSLGGLTRVRNHLAEKAYGASAYSALGTVQQNQLNDAIERAIDKIAALADWTWLKRQHRFTCKNDYTTGTVTVTNLSATVTGASTVWSTGTLVNADQSHFILGSQSSGYRITAVGSDTSLTISPTYGGATAATQTYQIVNDIYELATGCWWIRSIRSLHPSPKSLRILDMETWVHETGGTMRVGEPEFAIVLGADTAAASTTMEQQIQLWPAPDDTYNYVVDYRTLPLFPADNFESHPQAQGLVLSLAMVYCCEYLHDLEKAAYYSAQFTEDLPAFKRMDVARHGDTTIRAGRMWGPSDPEDALRFPVTGTTPDPGY